MLERLPKILFKIFLFLFCLEAFLRFGGGAYVFIQDLQDHIRHSLPAAEKNGHV